MKALSSSVLVVLLLDATTVSGIVNPHYIDHCSSCHRSLPAPGEGGEMDYHFLAEDIDPTCLICHEDACCTIGKPHRTHPSAIDSWDQERFGEPDRLPLADGYITCVTCHFWRRANNPGPEDYKLVRLVDIRPTSIDWTVLCLDCHRQF